jgi:hypothetical protein
MGTTIRVGCGAGFSDDRIDPAQEMAEKGDVDYLAFECLAERTIARENLSRLNDPEKGYTPYLAERFQAVLPACVRNASVSSRTWVLPTHSVQPKLCGARRMHSD